MNWVYRTIDPRKPSFNGENGIQEAVKFHFHKIAARHHPAIILFVKELVTSINLESKIVDSYTGTTFKIGELGFYPRQGKLHIQAPDRLITEVDTIAKKHFKYTDILKIYSYDEDLTVVITFPVILGF